MTTHMVVQGYFDRLAKRNGWESALTDDVVFTSFTSPVKEVRGKQAFLESTKRFYSGIRSFELRDLIVDGDRAVALTRYQLGGPGGVPHVCVLGDDAQQHLLAGPADHDRWVRPLHGLRHSRRVDHGVVPSAQRRLLLREHAADDPERFVERSEPLGHVHEVDCTGAGRPR